MKDINILANYFKGKPKAIDVINILILILEQVRDILESGQRQSASQPFNLEDYKQLNPTDEQIRVAIERLRAEGWLEKKVNWFAVHKVLIEIGIIKNDYKPYQRTVDYLKQLFPFDPTLDNLQGNMRKKCEGKNKELFSKELSEWCKLPNKYGRILKVTKRFFVLLKEE